MKKKLLSVLMCTALAATMLAGCGGGSGSGSSDSTGSASSDGGKTYAIVTKSAGNPYNEKEAEGFQEVIEAAGTSPLLPVS